MNSFDALNQEIVSCNQCPRLRDWCKKIAQEKRKSFQDQEYWGKPVPNMGDPNARGLILGLAPAAHGANRTGRMFTGDRSGDWLFRALHEAGLANQPDAINQDDGLQLKNVIITASCHCAPPQNKPTAEEVKNCQPFLIQTLNLNQFSAILCLGSLAWNAFFRTTGISPIPKFSHSAKHKVSESLTILGSYHPSQQNTFTGRLTKEMLDEVMKDFAEHIS